MNISIQVRFIGKCCERVSRNDGRRIHVNGAAYHARLRGYATHKQNFDHKSILSTSELTVVKQLKKKIYVMANSKGPIKNDTQFNDALKQLSVNRFPSTLSPKQISNELYVLILQNRVSDNEIYRAIQNSRKDGDIVNVKVPKTQYSKKKIQNTKTHKNPIPRDLKPQKTSEFDNLLQEILEIDHNHSNELHQILSNIIEESNELQEFKSQSLGIEHDNNQINIKILETYLHNIRNKQDQKKSVLEAQKKVYDWNHSFDSLHTYNSKNISVEMEPQRLFNREFWMSYVNKYFSNSKVQPIKESEYLFMNLKTNSESVETYNETTHSLIHLQQSDLLNIINRSSITPEEVLKRLKELQNKNWKLMGNITDSPEVLMFEKPNSNKKFPRYKYTIFLFLTGVTFIPLISYYRNFSHQDRKLSSTRT
ncbi:Mrx4p KABA2_02S02508 [Maudiozyma barnettii]|uniref:Uncharacterized protein n=1 Tax=Maudiozyma barnettii TaxID=61262 RepID=A0A8H2VCE9_9SACH|nr:uncharacterized protein KABA2_02S02508 [Kazachstania barnettii]CAB4252706.1 similar to Saccharomyces cerevisiae YPL168W Putative protein of unknown function [Kazachstania barnettii]